MFGMNTGPEYLQMLQLEKKTGKTLNNKIPNNLADGPSKFSMKHFLRKTFKHIQRYFYNFQYRNNQSEVVFLMIGGEGPQDIGWVSYENYPFVSWAKEFGAMMFTLEHRFYGESRPTPNQSVKNLRYLSSRQALEDIKYFIECMNAKYRLKNPKWIAFGGSYPGTYLETLLIT
ncbi:unnamed protein product [Strongylus vulgaris]|uniref:Serine carboxypeptidase S28 n=1 Tax=Strongylus vulgaris TaxID=40348 RepID=A0A3P7IMT3_STRVU|nr:unnamed protein product [Strongylus vulgaris]